MNDGTADWGATRKMSPFDVLMWRSEADPQLRSTVTAIEMLDATPDWHRMLAAHDWASHGATAA